MLSPSIVFAELEAHGASAVDVGIVITALATILLLIERVKAIFWPEKTLQEEFVRHAELDKFKAEQAVTFNELKARMETFVTRLELQRLEAQLTLLSSDQKDQAKASALKYDDLCKSISEVRITIEQVRREIRVETDSVADKVVSRLTHHFGPHGIQEA